LLSDLMLRFILGGLIVSAFSVVGDVLKPKSVAGIFGAAPSMALVTLGLAFLRLGSTQVAVQARSMVAGAVALGCYSWLDIRLLVRCRRHAVLLRQRLS